MASKRKCNEVEEGSKKKKTVQLKKHTLDSDEEDSDDYEKDQLGHSDIDGEEDGDATVENGFKITPFNMREELEEGDFDKDGHYHWKKDAEVRDNWLDNIDSIKINKESSKQAENDNVEMEKPFNESEAYKELLDILQPGETVEITLKRLGKSRGKLSSVERLRQKKLGIVDPTAEIINKCTELANQILTKTGNMDIYQETYEEINARQKKIASGGSTNPASQNIFDEEDSTEEGAGGKKVRWEFKMSQSDTKVRGPYLTEQMIKFQNEEVFKSGVFVRKVGEENFYSSNRIDFDLYI